MAKFPINHMKLMQLDRLVLRVVGLFLATSLVLSPVMPGVQTYKAKLWVDTDLVLSGEPMQVLPDNNSVQSMVLSSGYEANILPVDSLVPAITEPLSQKPIERPKHVLGASLVPVAPPRSDYAGVNVADAIVAAASEYGVSADIMIRIAQCESGLRAEAVNGPFAGIYQFISGTWVSNRNAMGLDPDLNLRYNPTEAAKTAAFKMSRDGYGAWPACSRKALAATTVSN